MRRNFVVVGNPADLHRNVTKQVDAEGRVRYYIDNERYYLTIRSANREAKRANGELRRKRSNPTAKEYTWSRVASGKRGNVILHSLREKQYHGPHLIHGAGGSIVWRVEVIEDMLGTAQGYSPEMRVSITGHGRVGEMQELARYMEVPPKALVDGVFIIPQKPTNYASVNAAKRAALAAFLRLKGRLESV